MTVGFILNGEDVVVRAEADARLADILRETFNLRGTKCGCLIGVCGLCSVIFNGKAAPACLIPAFQIRGSEVITIEGFAQTNEYPDIVGGFAQAGVETCGYCDGGKILATEALLERNLQPSREEIYAAFNGIRCRCTEPERLVEGVLAAIEIRRRRLYGRSS